MATKNFKQMSTKKLTALMATASDEDKATIQEILDARAQAAAKQDPNEHDAPENTPELTPEEEAAIAAAEANNGINPMYTGNGSKAKKPKMTEEELDAIVEKLQDKMLCKCQVLSMNTLEWQDGYIAGIVKDTKAGKVLYAIRLLNSGRKIAKVVGSNLIKVTDEKVSEDEAMPKKRANNSLKEKGEKKVDFKDEEDLRQKLEEASLNRGKLVTFRKFGISEEKAEGRITGIMVDRRVNRIMYVISTVIGQDEKGEDIVKKYNKMINSVDLVIAEGFDEEGQKIQDSYQARKNKTGDPEAIKAKTPEERAKFWHDRLEKAQLEMEALKARIQKYQEAYEKAIKEMSTGNNAEITEVQDPAEADDILA